MKKSDKVNKRFQQKVKLAKKHLDKIEEVIRNVGDVPSSREVHLPEIWETGKYTSKKMLRDLAENSIDSAK